MSGDEHRRRVLAAAIELAMFAAGVWLENNPNRPPLRLAVLHYGANAAERVAYGIGRVHRAIGRVALTTRAAYYRQVDGS